MKDLTDAERKEIERDAHETADSMLREIAQADLRELERLIVQQQLEIRRLRKWQGLASALIENLQKNDPNLYISLPEPP